jgi:hypothetical protein
MCRLKAWGTAEAAALLLLGVAVWLIWSAPPAAVAIKIASFEQTSALADRGSTLRVHIGLQFYVDKRVSVVMNHERMSRELWAFGKVLLPSLASQTSNAFDLHIYYNAFTPSSWTTAFAILVAPYPFARLIPVSNAEVANASLSQNCPPGDSGLPFVTTRIDAEEGLAPTFIERLRSHALAAWTSNAVNDTIVTMSKGHIFGYPDGRLKAQPVDDPYRSAGASLITRGSCRTIYNVVTPDRPGSGTPVLVDATPDMWVRSGDAATAAWQRRTPVRDAEFASFRSAFPYVPLTRRLPEPGAPGCWGDVCVCLQLNNSKPSTRATQPSAASKATLPQRGCLQLHCEPSSAPASPASATATASSARARDCNQLNCESSSTPAASESATTTASPPRGCSTYLRFLRYEPSLAEEKWGKLLSRNLDGPHCPPLFRKPYAPWVAAWIKIATLPRSRQGTAQLAAAAGLPKKLIDETMSVMHFTDACSGAPLSVLVEPLLGFMRDPRPVCPLQAASLALTQPRDRLQSKETTVRDDSVLSAWRRQIVAGVDVDEAGSRPRVLLFDLGASRYSDSAMPGLKWLVESLEGVGLRPDHVWAWEASKTTSLAVFTAGMPEWLRAITTFYNVPVAVSCPEPVEPSCRDGLVLKILAANARPEDVVVLKLDIDDSLLEAALVARILADAHLKSLIDEFYFEHHYLSHEQEMGQPRAWKRKPEMQSIRESFELFQELRRAGIVAHVWP